MKQLCVILLTLTLVSCSESAKLKRANKKIYKLTKKYPQLLEKDTLHDTVTFVTPEVRYDTQFVDVPGDTTYINYDKIEIKYVRVGDTTFIKAKCKSDTITQVVEIPYEKIVVQKQTIVDQLIRYFKNSIIWVIIFIILLFLIRVFWKFIKPF